MNERTNERTNELQGPITGLGDVFKMEKGLVGVSRLSYLYNYVYLYIYILYIKTLISRQPSDCRVF